MPYTQVANLDFEDIKIALKEYLRAQSDFTGYQCLHQIYGLNNRLQ